MYRTCKHEPIGNNAHFEHSQRRRVVARRLLHDSGARLVEHVVLEPGVAEQRIHHACARTGFHDHWWYQRPEASPGAGPASGSGVTTTVE